jgi:uncharacterized protein (UPF0332 family)
MVQKIKTVRGGQNESESMLRKATESLESAKADLAAARFNSAVSAAVRVGIQTCDAVCLALDGRRSADPDHNRTVVLLREAGKGSEEVTQKATQLQRLLNEKNATDYGIRRPSLDEATRSVARAESFHVWGKRQVELAYNLQRLAPATPDASEPPGI